MKNCFHGDCFKSYLPAKSGIFIFFQNFLSGYTCIRDFRYTIASKLHNDWSWCVELNKVLDCRYDLVVKGQGQHTKNLSTAQNVNTPFKF